MTRRRPVSRLAAQLPQHLTRALLAATALALAGPAGAAQAYSVPLIWHVETDDGKAVDSHEPDKPVNPASVVKLVTSLRAIETLGPDHRFSTTFGVVEAANGGGAAKGIVVSGGSDPDFHMENAVLVAHELAAAGIRTVEGDLHVGATFWMGWERGTAGRETDPVKRRLDMGRRLVAAWTPEKWTSEERQTWKELAARKGWDETRPPSVRISGTVRAEMPPAWKPVVEHRSEPLVVALRRFNVFSNNDIERLDASLGPASSASAFLEKKWGPDGRRTSFATSSGLNGNRMTPRLVVRMLRDLRAALAAGGHVPADIMPVLGCGHSTLYELFPRLRTAGDANGLVGKTGTLNLQDGGVSALAGFIPQPPAQATEQAAATAPANTGPGLMFFVAAPGAGHELPKARGAEEDWVRKVLLRAGRLPPVTCPKPVPSSSDEAVVVRAAPRTAS